MAARPFVAKFDGEMHRNALDNRPDQAGGFDLGLAGGDVVGAPDLAWRHAVKRRHHPVGAGLTDMRTCHRIIRPEPTPGFKHDPNPPERTKSSLGTKSSQGAKSAPGVSADQSACWVNSPACLPGGGGGGL